jgi:hypothetical protein
MRIATSLALMLGLAPVAAVPSGGLAQDKPRCQFVGVRDAGLLLMCGDRLNGFVLTLEDVRRQVVTEAPGRFAFRCVLAPMCAEEPNVGGFFFDPATWRDSAKDDGAMLDILQQHGLVPAAAPGAQPGARPPVACAVFDVTIADLPGRGVCFDVADGSAVVVIAGDDSVAVVLSFFQNRRTPGSMRERVFELIPQFKIMRPTGDVALLRWMR